MSIVRKTFLFEIKVRGNQMKKWERAQAPELQIGPFHNDEESV